MSDRHPKEIDLRRNEAARLQRAMDTIERLLGYRVAAVVLTDDSGRLHVVAEPGNESEVLRGLGSTDWNRVRRVVEEFVR